MPDVCWFCPQSLRTRSVPAPTVHRLFNGFWSERGRRGDGGGAEQCRFEIFFAQLKIIS